ncbi:hypothetical protein PIB30_017728 [Stylosanthes scabra]|uniref:Uncharacterized protein n=1 Tax=Stylosanthes scabra TaxID=79078 RepID=A0ABU6S7P2_9FABA|nr:hypothetical protein [Stylosanthes scabra]
MMPEGTGRPRWDGFWKMFGEPPAPPVADQCTVTFSWLRSTFGVLPDHLTDEMVLMHARAYIWMLLSICLFGDKTGAWAHVHWLPYVAHGRSRSIQLGVRNASLAVQEPVSSSQQDCRPDGRAVGSAAELDFLAVVYISPHIRRERSPTVASQEATRFDALRRVRMSPVSDVGGRSGVRPTHSAGGT